MRFSTDSKPILLTHETFLLQHFSATNLSCTLERRQRAIISGTTTLDRLEIILEGKRYTLFAPISEIPSPHALARHLISQCYEYEIQARIDKLDMVAEIILARHQFEPHVWLARYPVALDNMIAAGIVQSVDTLHWRKTSWYSPCVYALSRKAADMPLLPDLSSY